MRRHGYRAESHLGLQPAHCDENCSTRDRVAHMPRFLRCVRRAIADTADNTASAPPRLGFCKVIFEEADRSIAMFLGGSSGERACVTTAALAL